MLRLVLGDLTLRVDRGVDRLRVFAGSPPEEYRVKSGVSGETLRAFVDLIELKSHHVGGDTAGLRKLADEFDCDYVRHIVVEDALVARVEKLEKELLEERRARQALEKRVKDFEKQFEGKSLEEIRQQCSDIKRQVHARFSAKFVDAPFNGLFKQMWLSKGVNPVTAGLVSIKGSSYDKEMDALLPNLIDVHWAEEWVSENSQNAFLLFDFMKKKVVLTGYSLKTYRAVQGMSHLKSWIIEGSCDGKAWHKIDERMNTDVLNSKSKVCVFVCNNSDGFNQIRLRLAGPDHSGTYFIALANVEFFGSYY